MTNFQNISDFLSAPFGNVDKAEQARLLRMYSNSKFKRAIKISGYTVVDEEYFFHLSIPSDSNPNQLYDVVILFFTDNEKIKKEMSFKNYYIKFFSNSPSFMYQYAALYKQEGFLIDFLFDKMDKNYADVLPKTQKALSYDKSIYAACKYLYDTPAALSKMGLITKQKKKPERFFSDIKTFQDVKLTNDLNTLDKKIGKELEKNKEKKKEHRKKGSGNSSFVRKDARKDTLSGTSEKAIKMAKTIKASKGVRKTRKVKKK